MTAADLHARLAALPEGSTPSPWLKAKVLETRMRLEAEANRLTAPRYHA